MIINIDTMKQIPTVPHKRDFDGWKKNMSSQDYQKIVDELNQRIGGTEVQTSSWIPGSDWTGTVFMPIYNACACYMNQAAMFFGLILYQVMIDRPENWACGRYEKDGIPIKGMTYFRIQ